MTPEPKHHISSGNENSVDIEVGEKLFQTAIEVLQDTASLQELFKTFPYSNLYMKPVEFVHDGWEYQISISKIDRNFTKDKIILVRRQKDGEVEEIDIKMNYEDMNNPHPIQINCTYELYRFYEPTQKIKVGGEISVDFIRDFIDNLNF